MIETIKKAIEQGINNAALVGLLEGEVVSSSPLKVKLKKNAKLVIPKELLVVPESLTNRTINCSVSASYVSTSTEDFSNVSSNSVNITINNALKIGDKVMLISFEGKQKYFILDRI